MAAQIPVKAIYSGSDVTSLGEFTASDDITITYLPTGTSSSTVALGDHTHAYLPLAGGTLTGNLITTGLIDTRDVAADGVLATNAMPKSGGAFTGAITTNSTIDTVDIATRDGVLTTTTATAAAALPKAGGTMTGSLVLPTGNSTTGGLNLPTANTWITGGGHGVLQVDATRTYLYGGTNGVQFRTADNASELAAISNSGNFTLVGTVDGVDIQTLNTTAGAALPKAGGTMTGAVKGSTQTATLTAATTLDFGTYQNFVLTLAPSSGTTINLANPSTEVVGQSGFIAFIQDGTGSRLVTHDGDYETAAAAGLTLTATASATDLVPYLVVASNRVLLGTPQLAFA